MSSIRESIDLEDQLARNSGDMFTDDLTVAVRMKGNVSVRGHLHIARGGNLQGDVSYAACRSIAEGRWPARRFLA